METQHKRSAFSGKLGFVLSAAGASVGILHPRGARHGALYQKMIHFSSPSA